MKTISTHFITTQRLGLNPVFVVATILLKSSTYLVSNTTFL